MQVFEVLNPDVYTRWRNAKLAGYPKRVDDLRVEIDDPRMLRNGERQALLGCLTKANMVIYRCHRCAADRQAVRALGAALGLVSLDANPYADEDRISALSLRPEAAAKGYIPYTNRALNWHTDGYYNPLERRIRAFIMHCVHPAATGGENGLLDPEIAYIALRDRDPGLIDALMQADAMTIPANTGLEDGVRAAQTGPVFSFDPVDGVLHMRYTARTRSIRWKDSPALREALRCIEQMLNGECDYRFSYRLGAGEGLICNNVLHSRSAYTDAPTEQRLLYRARYYERVQSL